MGQQLQPIRSSRWRSGDGEKLWLSMPIDAMEEVARPELRSLPCEAATLLALRAQLARPASSHAAWGSKPSLRN
jgi:hypothetical protein